LQFDDYRFTPAVVKSSRGAVLAAKYLELRDQKHCFRIYRNDSRYGGAKEKKITFPISECTPRREKKTHSEFDIL